MPATLNVTATVTVCVGGHRAYTYDCVLGWRRAETRTDISSVVNALSQALENVLNAQPH